MNHKLTATSKFLSLVLRHRPEVIGVKLDEQGWLSIEELLQKSEENGRAMSLELIHEVVATNTKQRFSLSEDGLRIRANQGHSIANVDLGLEASEPPPTLYHGTVDNFLASIERDGLSKRSRHHVHLSADIETAVVVAQRRGKPIVLRIQAREMHAEGFTFFRSQNGVWLTDSVPCRFLRFPSDDEN